MINASLRGGLCDEAISSRAFLRLLRHFVPRNDNKVVVGLTGGLGSGKSTVLGMFKGEGAFTLDAIELCIRVTG